MDEELANANMFTRPRRRNAGGTVLLVRQGQNFPLVESAAGGAFCRWLDNPDRLWMPTDDWGRTVLPLSYMGTLLHRIATS